MWKGKSEKSRKGKKRKYWLSYFLATDCTTTLPGEEAEKKRHDKKGNVVASKFIARPKLVADYYYAMPGTDIVNRKRQFLLNLEESLRTDSVKRRIMCTMIGTLMANAHGMMSKWSPWGKLEDNSVSKYCRDVILDGLFDKTLAESSVKITQSIDGRKIDPYVHTIKKNSDLKGDVHRQQRCIMCRSEGIPDSRNFTSYYCGLCAITANREQDRKATRHAYCVLGERQCFA